MPPTTTLPSRETFFVSGSSSRTTNRVDFARMAETLKDPVAEWKTHFVAWIEAVKMFRNAEQETFLVNPDDPGFIRIHRGWTCELIATGEALAMALTSRVDPQNQEVAQQIQFLDTFIENLRSTLETWHPLEEPADNPLKTKA